MIQGTTAKLTITGKDLDTGLLKDPPDVQVAVQRPTGLDVFTYLNGEIVRLDTGRYRCSIDTSVEPGDYVCEIAFLGVEGVRKRRTFTVEPKIGP